MTVCPSSHPDVCATQHEEQTKCYVHHFVCNQAITQWNSNNQRRSAGNVFHKKTKQWELVIGNAVHIFSSIQAMKVEWFSYNDFRGAHSRRYGTVTVNHHRSSIDDTVVVPCGAHMIHACTLLALWSRPPLLDLDKPSSRPLGCLIGVILGVYLFGLFLLIFCASLWLSFI